MKIKTLEINNYRCFESLTINLESDLNIIVGTNGAGKSAVLDAFVLCLKDYTNLFFIGDRKAIPVSDRYEKKEYKKGGYYEPPDLVDLKITVEQANKPQNFQNPTFSWKTNSHTRHNPDSNSYVSWYAQALKDERTYPKDPQIGWPVVAYYPVNRLGLTSHLDLNEASEHLPDPETAFRGALDSRPDYNSLVRWLWLRDIMMIKNELFKHGLVFPDIEAIKRAIKVIFSDEIETFFFHEGPIRMMVRTEKGDFQIAQLSDGYKTMLGLVMDFATRLAIANPGLENPLEAPGILLIDEIELHLHPTWQQRVLPDLKRAFPNTQIIATTHSPQVLTTVENRCIQILKERKLYGVPGSTYGAESQRMLKEVLETNPRPKNEVVDELYDLFKLINDDHLEEAQEKLNLLIDKHGPTEPALVEAETSIKNRIWEKRIGL